MASSTLSIGQCLKGRLSSYTITKQIYESVWLASDARNKTVVIKSVRHVRLQNEFNLLKRFQHAAPFRPLVDEIQEPADHPAIILKHYDCHTGDISATKGLSTREAKYVTWHILKALHVLHKSGYVHSDVKPDNIMVDTTSDSDMRLKNACLSDLGNTVSVDSEYALNGYPLGTPIFRSPETTLGLPFDTAADIWSLGSTLISLIYGQGFDIFRPNIPVDHELYVDRILARFHKFFGPYPESFLTLKGISPEVIQLLADIMNAFPSEERKPFHKASSTEISNQDRDFICKMMKLDPRDRPTVLELLQDEWFADLGTDGESIPT